MPDRADRLVLALPEGGKPFLAFSFLIVSWGCAHERRARFARPEYSLSYSWHFDLQRSGLEGFFPVARLRRRSERSSC